MNEFGKPHWPLVLGLGAFALLRPLLNITGAMDQLGRPWGPVAVTAAITAVWVLAVGPRRTEQPVLTLVCAGLTYGVLSILLSAVLSPVLTGELRGPLATPMLFGVVSVLAVNAVWGAVAGALALGLRRLTTPPRTRPHHER